MPPYFHNLSWKSNDLKGKIGTCYRHTLENKNHSMTYIGLLKKHFKEWVFKILSNLLKFAKLMKTEKQKR